MALTISKTFGTATSLLTPDLDIVLAEIVGFINNILDSAVVKSAATAVTATTALNASLPGDIIVSGAGTRLGYLLCDGSLVNRADYVDLFVAIGTTFNVGGEPGTQFRLPDGRGVFLKGAGTTDRTLGKDASGNFYAAILGAYSTDKMQGHIHQTSGAYDESVAGTAIATGGGFDFHIHQLDTGGPLNDATNGTPRTGHTTEPQSLGVNFFIKY